MHRKQKARRRLAAVALAAALTLAACTGAPGDGVSSGHPASPTVQSDESSASQSVSADMPSAAGVSSAAASSATASSSGINSSMGASSSASSTRPADASSSTAPQLTSSAAASAASSSGGGQFPAATPEARARETLASMTLEEKAGQMFFLAFRQTAQGGDLLRLDGAAQEILRRVQPGGMVLFGENVDTVEQLRALIAESQALSSLPLFVSVDQEGGRVQRIRHTQQIPATDIPAMLTVGSRNDLSLTEKIGRLMARELRVFGFNMDFAPVCDVFSNPDNTVIGNRAFSTDPKIAAEQAAALAAGLSAEGIIPVLKHFPGHGDTAADTHDGFVRVDKTKTELWGCELLPFQRGIDNGAEVIMAAHISLPNVTGDETPASLSREILTGLLREEMGFDGVIITDALNMKAITRRYSTQETILLGIEAGVDLFLMPSDPIEAFDTLVSAVESGHVSMQRLDESVLRILTLKYSHGLFENPPLQDASILGRGASILEGLA